MFLVSIKTIRTHEFKDRFITRITNKLTRMIKRTQKNVPIQVYIIA